jgi:DUF2075 family protein
LWIRTKKSFDLTHIGIVFGNEIKYYLETKQIEMDASQNFDKKWKQGIEDAAT